MLLIRTFGRLASSDASTTLFTIKDSCLNRLKQILAKPNEEFLRINVETGGCSGFSYIFHIDNKQVNLKEDLVFERDNYRVVINKEIFSYLKGSSIEFSDSLIKSSFSITNPIADTKCSCGTSFSVDFNKLQQQEDQNNK